jgi:hypothetical protein
MRYVVRVLQLVQSLSSFTFSSHWLVRSCGAVTWGDTEAPDARSAALAREHQLAWTPEILFLSVASHLPDRQSFHIDFDDSAPLKSTQQYRQHAGLFTTRRELA